MENMQFVERDPKIKNSFRMLKVSVGNHEGVVQAPLCRDEERMVRRKL